MSVSADGLDELRGMCPGASVMAEGGVDYIHLPGLVLPSGASTEALLCPVERSGYRTRLYLSAPVIGKGSNWSTERILDRTWHTWSWNHVSAEQRPIEILAEHLRALR